MIDLYLIRHGQTEENSKNLCQGQTPGTLSEQGIEQAEKLSEYLKDWSTDCIYTSDLRRTVHTAEIIARHHTEVPFIKDKKLRERYMAAWQGNPFPPDWHEAELPEGSESHDDLMDRARAFIEELKQHPEHQTVWAISHGGMIRAFCTVFKGATSKDYYSWPKITNTSLTHARIHDDGHFEVLEIGATPHLS